MEVTVPEAHTPDSIFPTSMAAQDNEFPARVDGDGEGGGETESWTPRKAGRVRRMPSEEEEEEVSMDKILPVSRHPFPPPLPSHLLLLPPTQPWVPQAEVLLQELTDNENSLPFLQPVDTETYPVSTEVDPSGFKVQSSRFTCVL